MNFKDFITLETAAFVILISQILLTLLITHKRTSQGILQIAGIRIFNSIQFIAGFGLGSSVALIGFIFARYFNLF